MPVNNVDDRTFSEASCVINNEIKPTKEQKTGFFEIRNKINFYVKTCANNVKVVIYIDEQSIEFIAGDAENHINFYIKTDGSFEKEWIKRKEDDGLKYKIKTENVDAICVNDVIEKFKHKLERFEKQKQGLYNARSEIVGCLNWCSDNVRLLIFVDDVLPQPIVITCGKEENQLCIFIKIDGTIKPVWEKRTWIKHILDFLSEFISSDTLVTIARAIVAKKCSV